MIPSLGPNTDLPAVLPTRQEPRAPAESATSTAPVVRLDTFRSSLRTPLDADRRLALLGEAPFPDSETAVNAPQGETRQPLQAPSPTADAPSAQDEEPRKGGADASLTEEERQQVTDLKKRDQEVRAHEQAHLAAAGGMARGGAAFSYETGPDGRKYAVGGEVQIVMRSGRTPEETIRNARQVQAAAMAPANPSSTDQQTAAAAARMEQDARAELATRSRGTGEDPTKGPRSPSESPSPPSESFPFPATPDAPDPTWESRREGTRQTPGSAEPGAF